MNRRPCRRHGCPTLATSQPADSNAPPDVGPVDAMRVRRVQIGAAQRDQRGNRGVEDDRGRPVDSQIDLLFVFVLPAQRAAAGSAANASAASSAAARRVGIGENDIQLRRQIARSPRSSHAANLLDRRQFADVPRVPRDPRTHRSGRPIDERGLRLRDDAPQADRRSQSRVHRRVIRSRRADVPRRAVRRLQGEPHADAVGPRRAGAARARSVRGPGRARAHLRTVRSRRRDRHAGGAGARAPASTSPSSPATRTSSSSSATASASTTRGTRARGSTPAASSRSWACGPIRSSTCSRIDGRQHRQHQGRARHRRKGRARADRHARIARGAARGRADDPAEALPRGARRARGRRARQPGAGAHPHRRAGARSNPTRCAIAARRASVLTRCSRRSASERSSPNSRPPPQPPPATTRVVASLEELDAPGRATLRSAGRFGVAPIADAETSAVRAAIVGWSFSARRGRRATCRSRTRASPIRRTCRRARCSRGSDRCWPIRRSPKIGHDLKFIGDRGRARRRRRSRAASSTRWSPAICSTRRGRVTSIDGLALERAGYAALTEEDVARQGRQGA